MTEPIWDIHNDTLTHELVGRGRCEQRIKNADELGFLAVPHDSFAAKKGPDAHRVPPRSPVDLVPVAGCRACPARCGEVVGDGHATILPPGHVPGSEEDPDRSPIVVVAVRPRIVAGPGAIHCGDDGTSRTAGAGAPGWQCPARRPAGCGTGPDPGPQPWFEQPPAMSHAHGRIRRRSTPSGLSSIDQDLPKKNPG